MRFTLDSRSRSSFQWAGLLAAALVASGVGFPASGAPPAEPSGQTTALGQFPPHAATCVRGYLPSRVLLDASAAAPDPDRMIASLEPHWATLDGIADRCGFANTEQGGGQLGRILVILVSKSWSERQLSAEFSISADQLSAAMREIPADILAILKEFPQDSRPSDSGVAALRQVLGQASARLGLEGQRASLLLSYYILSTARQAPFE